MSLVHVVTGGTGALGRAVVERLLSRGDRVAVPYRGARGFAELRAAVGGGDALLGEPVDLGDLDAVRRFAETTIGRFGRVDGAALVAGAFAGSASFETAPEGEWEEMLAANLRPAYTVCRALLPHLLKGGGSVVAVGSRMAAGGGGGAAGYAVSKMAVAALMRALAMENRARGVRFNWVEPGTIDSAANRAAMPEADRARWTPAEDIADVIVFLLSPASRPVTGAGVPVDGPGRPAA